MRSARTIKRFARNPGLVLGSLIILAFVVIALAAPLIAPPTGTDSPYQLPRDGFTQIPEPPRPGHPLGTLSGQYDVFHGLVWGTRVAFWIGLSITLGRALLGIVLGLVSGYYGGLLDSFLMRVTDAFLAFPVMAAIMVVAALFATPWGVDRAESITATNTISSRIILTMILFGWMPFARVMRGNVMAERSSEYVQSAISVGAWGPRVMFRHLLPNATRGLFVLIASDIGAAVVLAATLNFLGLVPVSRGMILSSWGEMLNASRNWIITPSNSFEFWYTFVPASLAIVLFSMGWNLVGDGLRDVFDPRMG